MKPNFAVQQIAVEVQYADGMLWFDRSGEVQRKILRGLQPPFAPAEAPQTPFVATGLHSPTEYLTIDFNKDRLLVRQAAVVTPVRVQEAAKESWDVIAETFEVRKRVTRCGVRIVVTWMAESDEEVEAAMVGTGLVQETPTWATALGTPGKRSFIGIEVREKEQIRSQVHAGSIKIEGPGAQELDAFRAPHALFLDVDWSVDWTEEASLGSLRGEELKFRIREAWKLVNEKARLTTEAIERWNSSH